jgi:dTDP-4-dehydrorhamnose 3,5-epimerase
MKFTPLALSGAFRIDLDRRGDARGFFARLFCREEFAEHGLATDWVQMNTSYSRERGTLRGLHFQRPPMAEAKLVRCLKGAIRDVIVDLRAGSPTYGQHAAIDLDDDNRAMVYIPQGFAHGFQTLTPDAELLYMHSAFYSPAHEGGVHHADPDIGIAWPLPVAEISDRDRNFPFLNALDPIRL